MSLTLGMVGKSWIIGLLVLGTAVAWAVETPDDAEPSLGTRTAASAHDIDAALWGLEDLRERLAADPSPKAGLAALVALVAERGDARGHDTGDLVRSLEAAAFVLDAAASEDPGQRAHDLHVAAARGQLHRLGSDRDVPTPTVSPQHDPVAALLSLVEANGVAAHDVDATAIAELYALEPSVQHALAAVMTTFLAYQAADNAVEDMADLANVIAARSDLVLAAEQLALVIDTVGTRDGQTPLQIANVISIDLGPGANTYDKDFLLLIDAGGDEVYRNNAGGSGATEPRCSLTSGRSAAALIDLRGNDRYEGGLDCGANGGGFNGAGLLYDNMGDDVYIGGNEATNGGALQQGTGLILDVRGNDVYQAGNRGTNGGADAQAIGMILDADGDDIYTSGGRATNGGGLIHGMGALIDATGDDTYSALGRATNGGAAEEGLGLLVDLEGGDHYAAGGEGANGGATDLGVGALIDIAGADQFHAATLGSNGGGARAGIGLLFDHIGNDLYASGSEGVNGGAYAGGLGILLDAAGNDRYTATTDAVNGGAATGDIDGSDPSQEICVFLSVCYTPAASWGLLADLSGLDVFEEDDDDPSGTDRSVFPKGIVGAQLDFIPALDTPLTGAR